MTAVMSGVRVLEVAEHTFVPAAAALLCDWGAEVVKIEPVERGDASRGLNATDPARILYEHSNRGKRSLALDLSTPEGADILYRLAERSDVFLTNKLPRSRKNLKIDVEDLRARNPDLIYVLGSGQGQLGPDAGKGSYDVLSFWHRAGVSSGAAHPDGGVPFLPGPGFGDSLGAMTIAGGIMGALFHRERTGEAPVVDVSLLGVGMWGMGAGIGQALLYEQYHWPPVIPNPLSKTYRTKDGWWIALSCLQAGRYWAPFCEVVERPELVAEPRFADHQSLLAHHEEASALIREVFAERTVDEWRERLEHFVGQWTVVQDSRAAGRDPQAVANGYLQPCRNEGGVDFTLVTAPVQYDGQPTPTRRGPGFNEHGDAILAELGLDWDTVVDMKVRGVVG